MIFRIAREELITVRRGHYQLKAHIQKGRPKTLLRGAEPSRARPRMCVEKPPCSSRAAHFSPGLLRENSGFTEVAVQLQQMT